MAGITLVSLPELFTGNWNWFGFSCAVAATLAFSFANISAVLLRGKSVDVFPMTGLSMAYGTLFLAVYAFWTGQQFTFDRSPSYAI